MDAEALRATYEPAPTTVTVTPTAVVIIGPVNLLRYDKKCFTIKNTGGTAFSAGPVQATCVESPVGTPSPDDADWETIDTASFITLAAGAIKSFQVAHDSRKWWRVLGQVASGSTSARGYVTAGSM